MRRPGNIYARTLARAASAARPPAAAPWLPRGTLAGAVAALGDLGDGTGIDFIDANLTAIRAQVEEASLAAKITAAAAVAGGLASVLLIFRTGGSTWRR